MTTSAMGANHARAIMASFYTLDKLIEEIQAAATPRQPSPFLRIVNDLTPTQHEEVTAHVRHIREQMTHALDALGIVAPKGGSSVKGPILTRLSFAEIAVEETDPKRLRGFGPLSESATVTLERLLADLSRSIRAMRRAVEVDPGRDFAGRLARFDQSPIDLALLGKLERVIARRGFVELRGLLDALVEQLESGTFEIAVFGRVSSGKSSLLNAVVGLDVLPVGVTPVTAVPTRIVMGENPHVMVAFLSEPGEKVFPAERIAEFVSEAENPGNVKRVRRVTVTVNSGCLAPEVALVDTPGVGALATAGARETFTYLPRCDLGIVLLDPGGSISEDDIKVVRALRDSAVEPLLVVSKADLVRMEDRPGLADYIRAEVSKATGLDLTVHWVSSVGASANAGTWFVHEIEPLLRGAHDRAEASSRRKLAQLYETVVATLAAQQSTSSVEDTARAEVEQAAGEAERSLQRRLLRCDDLAGKAADLAAPIIRLATRRFLELPQVDEPAALRASMLFACDEVRSEVERELRDACCDLRLLLSRMASAVGVELGPSTLGVDFLSLPQVEMPGGIDTFRIPAGWLRIDAMRRRRFQEKVVHELGALIQSAVHDYAGSLRSWSRGSVDRLSDQFAAAAGPLRARVRARGEADSSVEDDLKLLDVRVEKVEKGEGPVVPNSSK
jgi:GTP-binding protein EngB required for normal cell division